MMHSLPAFVLAFLPRCVVIAWCLLFVVCAAPSQPLLAQSFTIFNADASGFPVVKAKFYALSKEGRPLAGLKEEDFSLSEGGSEREIVSVEIPKESDFKPISAVLTLDVSGSMTMEGRIFLAQEAGADWVRTIALDVSDCAFSSFDDNSYLNQDFTHSRTKLLNAIQSLKPLNGTDYDKGFIEPITGALSMARRGQNRRIVVFVTDGLGGGSERKIIEAARKDSITVYCITLGMKMPGVLRAIADSTGGAWFENITDREELITIYRRILFQTQNIQPATITWTSKAGCTLNREAVVRLNNASGMSAGSTLAIVRYVAPNTSLIRLAPSPRSLTFRDVGLGNSQGQRITLRATYQPVTILGIETNNALFDISGLKFPLRLEADETATFTVGFTGIDSVPHVARVDIRTDMCAPVTVFTRAIYGNKQAAAVQLMQITAPEGGNTLYSGADTVIAWSGLMPSDDVALDYSLDMGSSWLPITPKTNGLRSLWRVPPVSSSRLLSGADRPMLVRARQVWTPQEVSVEPSVALDAHLGSLFTVVFNKDGSKVLTSSADRTAKIFDAYTGTVLQSLEGHGNFVSSAEFSPDEKRILTTSYDNTIRMWDAETGSLLNTAYGQGLRQFFYSQAKMTGTEQLSYVNQDPQRFLFGTFSPDGTEVIATTDVGKAIRWKGTILRPHGFITMFAGGWLYSAQYSHDGKLVLTAGGDHSARLWSNSTTNVKFFVGHDDQVTFASFSLDEKRIVTTSFDNTARVWDIKTEKQLLKLKHGGNVWSARYSPDGRRILTAATDAVRVWNAQTGALELTIPGEAGGFHHAEFSPDGSRIVAAGVDAVGRIWDIGGGFLQEATSQTFSVIAPIATLREVNMGRAMLGMVKDSVCTVLVNTDKSVVRVRDIRFVGANAEDFTLVSGLPPFDVSSGSTKALEFRFTPKERGSRTATLEVITWTDTLRTVIRGEGHAKGFASASALSFGTRLLRHSYDTTFTVLHNTGTLPVTVSRLQKFGPDTEQFSFATSKRAPFSLDAGDSLVVKITFAPLSVGVANGGIRLDIAGVQKPVVVPLLGEGAAAEISASITATFLDNTGATLTFGANDTLKAREVRTTLIRPLLNYVFFDENSSELPARYRIISREQTRGFDETNTAQAFTTASVKAKQVRGIDNYYHVLNILGKRLQTDSKFTARIIGCNSDIAAERGNTRLSQDRAEAVRQYFAATWGIEEKRLKVQARNKPERASSSNDADGAAENRRVEIFLEPQEAMSPVASNEALYTAEPDVVRLSCLAASQEDITEWSLDLLAAPAGSIAAIAKQRIIATLSGTGTPPTTLDYRLSGSELRSIGNIAKTAQLQFQLRVINQAGQFMLTKTLPTLVSLESLRDVRTVSRTARDSSQVSEGIGQNEQISRFALAFFDFDKATLSSQNLQIINAVKSRLQPESEAIIVGYTDRVGDAAYNKRLSTDRAKTVAEMLPGLSVSRKSTSGVGESVLLYDNDLPEGRFYCRMVEIMLRNAPKQSSGQSPP
jgi:WD40 repeat protein/outer membrane protein OmpA-like peptidoglycan-associated protein